MDDWETARNRILGWTLKSLFILFFNNFFLFYHILKLHLDTFLFCLILNLYFDIFPWGIIFHIAVDFRNWFSQLLSNFCFKNSIVKKYPLFSLLSAETNLHIVRAHPTRHKEVLMFFIHIDLHKRLLYYSLLMIF